MGTSAPDAVKRLVDRFDPSRKVFQSGDYKEEQLRPEFLNGHCLTVRRSDLGVWTFLDPFFTALGWDMGETLDTIRAGNRGSGACPKTTARQVLSTSSGPLGRYQTQLVVVETRAGRVIRQAQCPSFPFSLILRLGSGHGCTRTCPRHGEG